MSYILDALKKSDQERKSGGVPTLQTVHIPVAVEEKKPWSLYGIITILLLLLAVVTGFMILEKEVFQVVERDVGSAAAVEVEKPPAKPEAPPQPQIEAPITKQAEILAQKQPVEVATVDASVASIPAVVLPVIEKKPVQVKKPQSTGKPLPELEDIAYLHELPEYLQQSIPDLGFAGHVYSSNAFNRSVIINGNEMAEGDRIMEGFIVKEITSSGVIFVFQETVFRVDILQDWSFE